MPLEDIKNIAIVGSGLMGHGIGLTFALAGYRVTLNDTGDAILDNALHHIKDNLEIFLDNGLIEKEEIGAALSRITTTSDLEKAVSGADFVTEAIIENTEAKKILFQKLDALRPSEKGKEIPGQGAKRDPRVSG